ncbi:hypothetical protein QEN19_002699 [Hanseniaspora menglaensis]
MSLISTLQRPETTAENVTQTTQKRFPSVYQQDGKPLSKEALYRYKLKYNNFQVDAADEEDYKTQKAVNGNIAAKLAVQKTESEKEQQKQALSHRDTPEEHYKRLLVHPKASLIAASKSHSLVEKKQSSVSSIKTTDSSTLFSHKSLVNAANMAAKKSQYEVDKNGNLRTSSISAQKMDLSKLKTVASEEKLESEKIAENKKFNLAKLIPQATKNAESLQSQRKGSNIPIPIMGLKTKHEFDPLVTSKYEIDSLTTLALKLADERVLKASKSVNNGKIQESSLFTNEEWNKIAVELVMQNKEQILGDLKSKQSDYENLAAPYSVKTGKDGRIYKLGDIGANNSPEALISLGNGLTLTQGEVTKLASKLMLPLLSNINADTKRQLIKQAEIDEDKRTFKVETVAYKEDFYTQQKREKSRELYEKKTQRKEDKLVSQVEKLEQKGTKVDMSAVLDEIKRSNDVIKVKLEKLDVIAVSEAKQTSKIEELNTGLNEVETVLSGLHSELNKLSDFEKESGVTSKQIQKNKYSYQLISSKIFKHEAQRDALAGSLSLEKSKLEDLAQQTALLQSSNEHLQDSIDKNLDKLDHLKELGKDDKDRNELLANLRKENKINLRSKQIFIRSSFNKNLEEIIAKVKEEADLDLKNDAEEVKAKDLERKNYKKLFSDVNDDLEDRKAISNVTASHTVEEEQEEIKDETEEKAESKKEDEDFNLENITDEEEDNEENASELVPPPVAAKGAESSLTEIF